MTIIYELFLHNSVKDLPYIIKKIKNNIPVHNLYCVVYNSTIDSIELFSTNVLFSERNLKKYEIDGLIIGIAYSKAYGIQLLKYIVQNCIDNNKDVLVKKQWF